VTPTRPARRLAHAAATTPTRLHHRRLAHPASASTRSACVHRRLASDVATSGLPRLAPTMALACRLAMPGGIAAPGFHPATTPANGATLRRHHHGRTTTPARLRLRRLARSATTSRRGRGLGAATLARRGDRRGRANSAPTRGTGRGALGGATTAGATGCDGCCHVLLTCDGGSGTPAVDRLLDSDPCGRHANVRIDVLAPHRPAAQRRTSRRTAGRRIEGATSGHTPVTAWIGQLSEPFCVETHLRVHRGAPKEFQGAFDGATDLFRYRTSRSQETAPRAIEERARTRPPTSEDPSRINRLDESNRAK